MKHYLWLAFYLLAGVSYAQKRTYTLADMPFEIDSITGGIVYKGVIKAPGVTADQLYSQAKLVLSTVFPKDNQINQAEDQAKGLIKGRGRLFIPMNSTRVGETNWKAYYEVPIEIQVKDGEYSYLISSIDMVNKGKKSSLNTEISKSLPTIHQQVLSLNEYDRSLRSVRPFIKFIKELKRGMKPHSSGFFSWLR
jgi:hypothetical protein